MAGTEKIRENRLRRMAERQGLRLEKSRRRDPLAWDFETYQLVDPRSNAVVAQAHAVGHGYGLTLDEIEHRLTARYRGIASFMAAHTGTVEAGTNFTIRSNEPPDFGLSVYAGDTKLGSVVLVSAEGDTRERLNKRLVELYP
jgi:hypothetical protein